ncbi:MAG TPA: HEAT repeat domain-containing protein, partial [Thermoanaerobaculia bacterium]
MKRNAIGLVLGLVLAACGTSPSRLPDANLPPRAGPGGRLEALIAQLGSEETRSEARAQLEREGGAAIPALLRHIEDDSVSVRWEVVNLLGTILDERGIEPLARRAIDDVSHHVRWRSLWALAMFRKPEELTALFERGLASDDARRRWNAAIALSMFGSAAGLDLLHAGVRNPDPFQRWEAINALGRVHDARTVSVLAPALRSP